MRLYGSLTNRLMENTTGKPEVGMAATILMHSDRHAATVVAVSPSGKTISIQQDDAKVIKGSTQDGSAEYEYTRNDKSYIMKARQDKQGRWRECGGRSGILLGHREEHYDPSF
jgi:hypothetical protein